MEEDFMSMEQMCLIEEQSKRLRLWRFAFQGLGEIKGGATFLMLGMVFQIFGFSVFYWLLLPVFGMGTCISWFKTGKSLHSFLLFKLNGYYEKRTGYMKPRAFPRNKMDNKMALVLVILIGLGMVLVFTSPHVPKDAKVANNPVFIFLVVSACLPFPYLWIGLRERYVPHIVYGVITGISTVLCAYWNSDAALILYVYIIGCASLLVGIIDHRLYLQLWKSGAVVKPPQ